MNEVSLDNNLNDNNGKEDDLKIITPYFKPRNIESGEEIIKKNLSLKNNNKLTTQNTNTFQNNNTENTNKNLEILNNNNNKIINDNINYKTEEFDEIENKFYTKENGNNNGS